MHTLRTNFIGNSSVLPAPTHSAMEGLEISQLEVDHTLASTWMVFQRTAPLSLR
jgi:hypothetical protein